jgi:poly-gamma-glutamate synthesis protein (capsule biosynthesis protein)
VKDDEFRLINIACKFALVICALLPPSGAQSHTIEPPDHLTFVFVGDTGTNASGALVSSNGGYKTGALRPIAPALQGIAPWLKGDVVFANLESIVSDNNKIAARDKMFVFRMHPEGLRALMRAGVNTVSLANNHAMDFGPRGAGETLNQISAMAGEGLLAWPGLGRTRDEALAPQRFRVKEMDIAISAFGIGGGGLPAANGHAGMARGDKDFSALVERLEKTKADMRILSVHYGPEFAPIASSGDVARLRHAAALPGTPSIIVGHHAHVARGMELTGNHLVLYGLGNFMHFGTQNMSRFDICRDFGVLVKVGVMHKANGTSQIETVEAVPLTGMHVATKPMTGDAAHTRLAVLNYLGARLDNEKDGTRGLRFAEQPDGSGLWCNKDATDMRCKGWSEPALPSGALAQTIKAACNKTVRRGG